MHNILKFHNVRWTTAEWETSRTMYLNWKGIEIKNSKQSAIEHTITTVANFFLVLFLSNLISLASVGSLHQNEMQRTMKLKKEEQEQSLDWHFILNICAWSHKIVFLLLASLRVCFLFRSDAKRNNEELKLISSCCTVVLHLTVKSFSLLSQKKWKSTLIR